jgi:hypothetical protein
MFKGSNIHFQSVRLLVILVSVNIKANLALLIILISERGTDKEK